MSERLQNVLRILEGGAAERRKTQSGVGGTEPVRVHRIVDVGSGPRAVPDSAPSEQRAPESQAPVPVETPAEEPNRALAVYAPAGDRLAPTVSVVRTDSIPLPDSLDRRLVILTAPESIQAKSFRLLAHRIRHDGDPRTIVVTSARPGEGKTTCAANLALALAEDGGARVLLLEANTRTPELADLFGIAEPVGLARQMARLETALVPWTTHEVGETRLSVLASERGERASAPSRSVFASAIWDLRQSFDYIIVDAPSVLDSADVMALGDAADAVVIAARARKTRTRDLERTIAELHPAPVLGAVLLDSREAKSA